jgi:hypothetical protein
MVGSLERHEPTTEYGIAGYLSEPTPPQRTDLGYFPHSGPSPYIQNILDGSPATDPLAFELLPKANLNLL